MNNCFICDGKIEVRSTQKNTLVYYCENCDKIYSVYIHDVWHQEDNLQMQLMYSGKSFGYPKRKPKGLEDIRG